MFRPNIRSSSGLRQTKSLVLCVYWDPNMFDSRKNTENLVSIYFWLVKMRSLHLWLKCLKHGLVLLLCFRASSYKSNEIPTWCNTVQVLFLQSHSSCFGRFVPNMVMWWATCNYKTCIRGRRASFLILLIMGAWRPKHVEWVCRNKTCTV